MVEAYTRAVMGPAMRYSGFVEVDRARRTRAVKSLSAARERMTRDGTSVWIAPEGTRSTTGEIRAYRMWWLVPVIAVAAILGTVVVMGGSKAALLIYALF